MTGGEDIAKAIRDGFHELAEAMSGTSIVRSPEPGTRAPQTPSRESMDPEPSEEPQSAVERVAQRIADCWPESNPETWIGTATALYRSGLLADPRPMTVGQLGAQHIGKRVSVGESVHHIRRIENADGRTELFTVPRGRVSYTSGTPCTVTDA